MSRLQRASTKAETFSTANLKGYNAAEQTLNNVHNHELEAVAQTILTLHRISSDREGNVSHNFVLLLPGIPVDARFLIGGGTVVDAAAADMQRVQQPVMDQITARCGEARDFLVYVHTVD